MKKYLLGIVAVVLAISFSAFSNAPKAKNAKLTSFYWYDTYTSGGNTYTNTLQFSGAMKTESEAITSSGCPDHVNQPICVAGFSTQVGSDVLAPTDESKLVRKN